MQQCLPRVRPGSPTRNGEDFNTLLNSAIVVSVTASFILNGDPTVKQFGVGLSVGVALAELSVLALAPAILVLAGRGSWWVPAWAERVLPRIDIEGASVSETKG